jgi:hypothetical protein
LCRRFNTVACETPKASASKEADWNGSLSKHASIFVSKFGSHEWLISLKTSPIRDGPSSTFQHLSPNPHLYRTNQSLDQELLSMYQPGSAEGRGKERKNDKLNKA